ncbi:hypothetical protein COCON_G00145150 [Conger conger]|uniref:Sushi domain-containing protein n=1 Tax=Conger conger TaxID=82655 RepID=A0A9Q1HW37_CONCO|nr:membrane cofactor protein-like [Conger conger]XP_061115197.1 membrane cofactor protein-like [Conger conger]KAJ8265416.1 hypothetical protein COCON_G00145150 [Conger conger]
MFRFEISCNRFLRLWVLALLCLTLAAVHSHAQCPQPGTQGNAVPSSPIEEEYSDGSKITYECIPGYVRQSGSSTITCNNGTWSRLTLICEKKSCGPPPDVLNGQWVGNDIEFGATVTLKCNTGYKVGGRFSTMQCEVGGWNGNGFVCEAVKCPLPPNIPNGIFSPSEDKEYLLYGQSVAYSCEKTYTLFGNSQLTCTENGTYNADPPECRKVNCPQPEVQFGTRVEGGPPPYGQKSFIVYKCNEGYEMSGSSRIVCEDNIWVPKPPVCQKAQCPQPGRQGNAVPSSAIEEEYSDGSKITYECIPGYVRQSGSSTITCNNGTWSRLTLICEKKSCGPPPDVLNGQWVGNDIEFGATVTLKCNTGYKVGGRFSTMQCEVGGWNGNGFVCEAVKCPLPPNIPNGIFSPSEDKEYLLYGQSVAYSCEKTYTLFGNSQLTCTENGTYNADPPECRKVNCPQPEVQFGTRVEGGPPPYGQKSFIVYKCNEGYEMSGSSRITCEDNIWVPKTPVCQKSGASCTGSFCTEVYSALVQRVVLALLIPVGLHLSL